MFVHAQDAALGVIVSRQTAEGTASESIDEAARVVRAFDAAPCAHAPKLHLIEIDPGAPMPGIADRGALAQLARATRSPRRMACVLPTRQGKLALDIILLLSPMRKGRQLEAFQTRGAALIWLLHGRPDAHARMVSLAREVDRLAQANPSRVQYALAARSSRRAGMRRWP